mmetsp:Transcript_55216/g.120756  ORF Transcript_55216/g.120756 Transcript_55216/m.120756 type:complete len:234 (-) Transcript_55216:204-905(-)
MRGQRPGKGTGPSSLEFHLEKLHATNSRHLEFLLYDTRHGSEVPLETSRHRIDGGGGGAFSQHLSNGFFRLCHDALQTDAGLVQDTIFSLGWHLKVRDDLFHRLHDSCRAGELRRTLLQGLLGHDDLTIQGLLQDVQRQVIRGHLVLIVIHHGGHIAHGDVSRLGIDQAGHQGGFTLNVHPPEALQATNEVQSDGHHGFGRSQLEDLLVHIVPRAHAAEASQKGPPPNEGLHE